MLEKVDGLDSNQSDGSRLDCVNFIRATMLLPEACIRFAWEAECSGDLTRPHDKGQIQNGLGKLRADVRRYNLLLRGFPPPYRFQKKF